MTPITLKNSFINNSAVPMPATIVKETKAGKTYEATDADLLTLKGEAERQIAFTDEDNKLVAANVRRGGEGALKALNEVLPDGVDHVVDDTSVGRAAGFAPELGTVAGPVDDPSRVTYDALLTAFARFNAELFEGRLPQVMLVLQRKRNAHGYFWADQWKDRDGDVAVEEIALNPETMGRTVPEVLSTLVHEMTHLEQQHFGKPGKNGHHNKEWGDLMDRVGLSPKGVGKCEGKRTGRTVSHTIVDGGPFEVVCAKLIEEGLDLSYVTSSFNDKPVKKRDRSKVKHECPTCDTRVWCKEGTVVKCGDCDEYLEEA